MAIATDVTVPLKELVVMSIRTILVAVVAVISIGAIAPECQAQNVFTQRRPLRWLGQGFSNGYHRCNPAYDSSYYNPYSAHNSHLVSRSAEYIASENRYPAPAAGRFFSGVPFSVYAAPPRSAYQSVLVPGQPSGNSYAPADSAMPEPNDSDNQFQFEDSPTGPTKADRDDLPKDDAVPGSAGDEDGDKDISDLDELSLLPLFRK